MIRMKTIEIGQMPIHERHIRKMLVKAEARVDHLTKSKEKQMRTIQDRLDLAIMDRDHWLKILAEAKQENG